MEDKNNVLALQRKSDAYRGKIIGATVNVEAVLNSIIITVRHEDNYEKYFSSHKYFGPVINDFLDIADKEFKGVFPEEHVGDVKKDLADIKEIRNVMAHWVLMNDEERQNSFDGQTVRYYQINKGQSNFVDFNEANAIHAINIVGRLMLLLRLFRSIVDAKYGKAPPQK